MNKYHNQITKIDGINFDSKLEAQRYGELLLLEKAGQISELKVHPRYMVAEGQSDMRLRPIYYVGDFEYREGDRIICEDIKGGKATQTAVFKMKAKLFRMRFKNIELRIVN